MTSRTSVASVEYLRLPVTATVNGVAFDPTSSPVEVAIVASGTAPTGWVAGAWETGGTSPPYIVRILIGPGTDFELAAGRFDVYWRIDASPEMPAVLADELVVYGAAGTRFLTVGELGDFLGKSLDPEEPRANLATALATASIQAATRQTLALVTGDLLETQGNYSRRIELPQRPVLAVSAVTIAPAGSTALGVPASAYTWDSRGSLELATALTELGSAGWEADYWGGAESIVSVTYDHGFAVIPDDLKLLALVRAARGYRNPDGVAAESILSYSVTYGRGDTSVLSPADEARIIGRYRRSVAAVGTRAG